MRLFLKLAGIAFMVAVIAGCSSTANRKSGRPDNCTSPDFNSAAKTIGISDRQLKDAFGDPKQDPPNFAKIAKKLGITEKSLKKALKIQEGIPLCPPPGSFRAEDLSTVTINSIDFKIPYKVFTWAELPSDVIYERQPVQSYTNSDGITHYYETVYVACGNLNWYQAAYLAQDAGGYLASITSEGENTFVFNLVSDKKYFWFFEEDGPHHGIGIGPFLGGYQPEGSPEPASGWRWLSGEPWSYTNWCKNLDDGVIDKDPRPNDQPNDSGSGQPIMGFGEMNLPVPTWGDYMGNTATYGGGIGSQNLVYGFVIEYESNPN
jgi:hypothetical protein